MPTSQSMLTVELTDKRPPPDDETHRSRSGTGSHRNETERDSGLHPNPLGGNLYPQAEGMYLSNHLPKVDKYYSLLQAPVALLSQNQGESQLWSQTLSFYRYRWTIASPYMTDAIIAVTMLLILLGSVALAIALVTGVVLKPISYANLHIFSSQPARNIILNSIPSFTVGLGNIIILQSDTYHRMLQPIRGMDKPASAQQSILIDYLSPDPLTIITTSISNGHYRIAWGSFLSMICSTGRPWQAACSLSTRTRRLSKPLRHQPTWSSEYCSAT